MTTAGTQNKAHRPITERDKQLIDQHATLWIDRAMRTDSIEPDKIIPAIEGLYRHAGMKTPRVIIVPSPLVMAFAFGAAAAIWHCRKHYVNVASNHGMADAALAAEIRECSNIYSATVAAIHQATNNYCPTHAASFELLRASDGAANELSGEIRVAVTEGLGTFWLAPRLVEFQQSFPNIVVDLHCAMHSADVSRYEADVAIHLSRPAVLDVKLVRLGRMHLMLFASESYIETHGTPRSLSDMAKHRLVLQGADEAAAKEAFASVFSGYAQQDLVAIKTNVSSTNYFAVANGAGIGVFPSYACALVGAKLIPLDLGLHWSFDIWLSYHPTSGRIPRVRQMIDWLIEAFNPAKYPWFRDELIHPGEIDAVVRVHP